MPVAQLFMPWGPCVTYSWLNGYLNVQVNCGYLILPTVVLKWILITGDTDIVFKLRAEKLVQFVWQTSDRWLKLCSIAEVAYNCSYFILYHIQYKISQISMVDLSGERDWRVWYVFYMNVNVGIWATPMGHISSGYSKNNVAQTFIC